MYYLNVRTEKTLKSWNELNALDGFLSGLQHGAVGDLLLYAVDKVGSPPPPRADESRREREKE